MSENFVRFDSVLPNVIDTLKYPKPTSIERIYAICDLYGKVRLAAPDAVQHDAGARQWLEDQAKELRRRLGAHSRPLQDTILFLDTELVKELHRGSREIHPGIFWVDRLLTGAGWWTVNSNASKTSTYTLYSVKGGMGRSTTAAVLAWHLARRKQNVLVVDLDLESPGISSAMLDGPMQPEFGVVDWFVEDMVDQGDHVIEGMIASPRWHTDFPGNVHIVPAHGVDSDNYLAKLGRVYMDTDVHWTSRLERLLSKLRQVVEPSIVLVESRSGLHDIAAATVTALNAHVLLFATNSETNWQDYGILFSHWNRFGLAKDIRQRLSIVSSLTPDLHTQEYMERFRERSWTLFQDYLYDSLESKGRTLRLHFRAAGGPRAPQPDSRSLDARTGSRRISSQP